MAVSGERFYEELDALPMPLSAFIERYCIHLPQVVAVNESLYGVCSGSFFDGQLLYVYFKRETKVVDVRISSRNYIVPVTSQLKASVLYNPHNNLEKAKEGYYFATVADLIKAVPQPSVVSVGKKWTSAKDSSLSLQKGQILIVKKIDSSSRKRKKLYCIDPETNTSFCLEDTCKGHFTTQLSLISIDLQLLLEHHQLPISVSLSHDDTKIAMLLRKEIVVIHNHHLLQSIIATPKRYDYDNIPNKVIEIISSVPIDVRRMQTSEEEKLQLSIEAQGLAKILKPSLLTEVVTDVSPVTKILQQDLLKSIPEHEWRNGIHNINICEYEVLPHERETIHSPTEQHTDIHSPPPIPPRPSHDSFKDSRPPIPPRSKRTFSESMSPKTKTEVIIPVVNPSYDSTEFCTNVPDNIESPLSEKEQLLKQLSELKENNVQLTTRLHGLEKTMNGIYTKHISIS